MALPDIFKRAQGTAVIWGDAGGTSPVTVTNTLTLDALASAAARMGDEVNLGALWNQEYAVHLWVETGTAPTAGTTVELYLACSYDGVNWPGKVTGSDAAYPSTVANNKRQLGPPANVLIATNDTNTLLYQQPTLWRPKAQYVAPVVVNLLGQAFRDLATASDHKSRVILIPLLDTLEE